jgi:hypothetical protein
LHHPEKLTFRHLMAEHVQVRGKVCQRDFTPGDMEAVQSCLEGIDRKVPVAIEGAAAKLLMPNTVRTVADILDLQAWPSEGSWWNVSSLPPRSG